MTSEWDEQEARDDAEYERRAPVHRRTTTIFIGLTRDGRILVGSDGPVKRRFRGIVDDSGFVTIWKGR